jgi:hypothetical protein
MTTPLECEVRRLRPTQLTVGMIEVHDKRHKLRSLDHDTRKQFLRERPIPAVAGPESRLFITDHHHLGRALVDESIEHAFFIIQADYSRLEPEAFWSKMAARSWVHPVDEHGRHRSIDSLPKHLAEMVDDPYRSLAGYVRNAGGYRKTDTAFAEFSWADFFRRHLVIGEGREAFDAAVEKALQLAHSADARDLPGYLPQRDARARDAG